LPTSKANILTTSDANAIDIEDLNLNNDYRYNILAELKLSTANTTISMYAGTNSGIDTTTTNYKTTLDVNGNINTNSNAIITNSITNATDNSASFNVVISKKPNGYKNAICAVIGLRGTGPGALDRTLAWWWWNNNNDNLTKLRFAVSSGTINSGSKIMIWKW